LLLLDKTARTYNLLSYVRQKVASAFFAGKISLAMVCNTVLLSTTVLMKILLCLIIPVCLCGKTLTCSAGPATALPRSTPEEQGISSAAILEFIKAADRQVDTMNSFMLVRHGHVVAEAWWAPYDSGTRHELYSLSKSFTSTAIGMLISDGRLSLDDRVLSFFPEDAPAEPGENLQAMRVRDLLCMSTGHHEDEVKKFSFVSSERLTRQFLAMPVAHKPGTHFVYNTAATYMLSAIAQKITGKTLLEFLGPRLFDPLGIQEPLWAASPQGISLGGFGLSIRTEDIARLGQLYLQKGQWQGRQLAPASWIEAATARQTSNGSDPESDWEQGYGYQFWRCRHGLYRGDGAFGQFCIVMPEQDAVVAITSGTRNMGSVMNLVWDNLLPAMQQKRLKANPETHKRLKTAIAGLAVHPAQGAGNSTLASHISGRRFVFPANSQNIEAISLECTNGSVTLLARVSGIDHRIDCSSQWSRERFGFGRFPAQPAAATGAWASESNFTAKICFYETPFYITLNLAFSGDQVVLDCEHNVSFGPTRQPQLTGSAAAGG